MHEKISICNLCPPHRGLALAHRGAGTRLDCGAEGTEPLADDSGPLRGGRGEFWQAYCERGAAISVRWLVITSALNLKDEVKKKTGAIHSITCKK